MRRHSPAPPMYDHTDAAISPLVTSQADPLAFLRDIVGVDVLEWQAALLNTLENARERARVRRAMQERGISS
jgi:hypothetical protein